MVRLPSLAAAAVLLAPPLAAQIPVPTPPPTRQVEQVDDYHGTKVADPYRWLEDQDGAPTAEWVTAQNAVTFDYLARLPRRQALRERLTKLWNYERYGVPFSEAGTYFYSRNDGLQNQSVLYVQRGLAGTPRVLIDPNTLSSDGTVALTNLSPSPDASLLAWGRSASGSDWQELRVRDVRTGQDRPDVLRWLKFSAAEWTKDGKGFFYSRFPAPADGKGMSAQTRNQQVWYHRLGDPQSADRLIYERPDQPLWYIRATLTEDGRYLLIYANEGTDRRDRVYVLDLRDPKAPRLDQPVRPFLEAFDAAYDVLGNDGTRFYFSTDQGAPNKRIVAIELGRPEPSAWQEIVPERQEPIQFAALVGDQFVIGYLSDVKSVIRRVTLAGKPLPDVALPGIGAVGGVSAKRGDRELFFGFSSFLYPTTIFRLDLVTGRTRVFKAPTVDFDPSAFETTQVFYTSKDGTRVPMFITGRKGLPREGVTPTLLYAYGGFNVNVLPSFSPARIVWMEQGGLYAVPNLRGGSEYGERWHQAGMLDRKQNVFDDFIGAAEYLVREGYTNPRRLAIQGGSNGGLLVGAVMTQRPELFGVALLAVGVMDMLRYHRFTVGWGWVPEYGSADSASQFPYLAKYSPLHNLKPGTDYPATLVTTADHDDRVVPGHSFKFAAALQAASAGRRPALIRIETKAGHGGGKPTGKVIEETADLYAFTLANLGVTAPVP
ncbi:MAG: prolyl oligopeptidase family serine peptidase [Gemmatimonadales bacterium]|nr:prolyl oligopeptidase family serine peptidase [Gemmatimonadales bacterium]